MDYTEWMANVVRQKRLKHIIGGINMYFSPSEDMKTFIHEKNILS